MDSVGELATDDRVQIPGVGRGVVSCFIKRDGPIVVVLMDVDTGAEYKVPYPIAVEWQEVGGRELPDDVFYGGEEPIMEGRILYDTADEQYCAVRECDGEERVATVVPLAEADDGDYETRFGTFEAVYGETFTINWIIEGGRYIPK